MSCPACNHHNPAAHLCVDHYQTFQDYLEDHRPTVAQQAADHLRMIADRLDRLDRNPHTFDGDGACNIGEGATTYFVDVAIPGAELNLNLDIDATDNAASKRNAITVTSVDLARRVA